MHIVIGTRSAAREAREAAQANRMARASEEIALVVYRRCPCGRTFKTKNVRGKPPELLCRECDVIVDQALDAVADKHLDGNPYATRTSGGVAAPRR